MPALDGRFASRAGKWPGRRRGGMMKPGSQVARPTDSESCPQRRPRPALASLTALRRFVANRRACDCRSEAVLLLRHVQRTAPLGRSAPCFAAWPARRRQPSRVRSAWRPRPGSCAQGQGRMFRPGGPPRAHERAFGGEAAEENGPEDSHLPGQRLKRRAELPAPAAVPERAPASHQSRVHCVAGAPEDRSGSRALPGRGMPSLP